MGAAVRSRPGPWVLAASSAGRRARHGRGRGAGSGAELGRGRPDSGRPALRDRAPRLRRCHVGGRIADGQYRISGVWVTLGVPGVIPGHAGAAWSRPPGWLRVPAALTGTRPLPGPSGERPGGIGGAAGRGGRRSRVVGWLSRLCTAGRVGPRAGRAIRAVTRLVPGSKLARRVHGRRLSGCRRVAAHRPLPGYSVGPARPVPR
jgi:hypothetical protein